MIKEKSSLAKATFHVKNLFHILEVIKLPNFYIVFVVFLL